MDELKKKQIVTTALVLYKLADKNHDVVKMIEVFGPFIDEITDGLWIWDINKGIEGYSNRFREVLGFNGEEDFPSVPASWQKQIFKEDAEKALKAFEAHRADPEKDYYLKVRYRTKKGKVIKLLCSGVIVNREEGQDPIMIGIHELIP